MLSLTRRCRRSLRCLPPVASQLPSTRFLSAGGPPTRRRPKPKPVTLKETNDKSEWWAIDGEMHEIGENVPPRERFIIPRDNIPNRRRKNMREQFMNRTCLTINETDQNQWCKRYLELYQELRENWEKLYWDEGYSKKHGNERATYDSSEDDNDDFSPYRTQSFPGARKTHDFVRTGPGETIRERVGMLRDKFEFDRDRRFRERAFAPMRFTAPDSFTSNPGSFSSNPGSFSSNPGSFSNNPGSFSSNPGSSPSNQSFDAKRYVSSSDSD